MLIFFKFKFLFLGIFLFLTGCQTTIDGYQNCNGVSGYCNGGSITKSGEKYIGEHLNSKRHGIGKYYWNDGTVYDGFWNNDYTIKKGTYYFRTGDRYEGEHVNNVREGYGIYYAAKPENLYGWIKYEGYWKNNSPFGQGTATYPDGKKITGNFNGYSVPESKNLKDTNSQDLSVKKAKEECADLGFKDKSEKFAECVLDLIK